MWLTYTSIFNWKYNTLNISCIYIYSLFSSTLNRKCRPHICQKNRQTNNRRFWNKYSQSMKSNVNWNLLKKKFMDYFWKLMEKSVDYVFQIENFISLYLLCSTYIFLKMAPFVLAKRAKCLISEINSFVHWKSLNGFQISGYLLVMFIDFIWRVVT